MYLELRTWKGGWFDGEPALSTRAFGRRETPPPADQKTEVRSQKSEVGSQHSDSWLLTPDSRPRPCVPFHASLLPV